MITVPETLRFDANGLIPAIAQDADDGQVLMFAYMNAEAVAQTLETGLAHYYSRSRGRLWRKGEESGHVQRVREIRYDCDEDTLLLKVEQEVAACHTGHRSCFYRQLPSAVSGETEAPDATIRPSDRVRRPRGPVGDLCRHPGSPGSPSRRIVRGLAVRRRARTRS